MNTKKWTCKDGTRVRIKDMGDDHLVNTIKWLQRHHQYEIAAAYSVASTFSGESMASYYADQDIDYMEQEESMHPLYNDLVEEAERRNLL